jgi:hypothetical protein
MAQYAALPERGAAPAAVKSQAKSVFQHPPAFGSFWEGNQTTAARREALISKTMCEAMLQTLKYSLKNQFLCRIEFGYFL